MARTRRRRANNRRMNRRESRGYHGRQTYYYLYAKNGDEGRPLISGPYATAGEATSVAYSNEVEGFEVIPLNTANQSVATQRIKAIRLHEGIDLEYASQRFKHDIDKIGGK